MRIPGRVQRVRARWRNARQPDGADTWPEIGQARRLLEPSLTIFDPFWYAEVSRGMSSSGHDGAAESGLEHFLRDGARRGRDPNAYFSEIWYRRLNPDVDAAIRRGEFVCGFQHFVVIGAQEGRTGSPLVVDEDWYSGRYPDVTLSVENGEFVSPAAHYLFRGARERRDPQPAFCEDWYLCRYPDVAVAVGRGRFLCGYREFLDEGMGRGRQPHPDWSEHDYLELNPDVADRVAAGEYRTSYEHFMTEGLHERRAWLDSETSDPLRKAADRLAATRLDEFLASNEVLELPRGGQSEVSIVIVVFNRADLTLQCLRSLQQLSGVRFEVVVVDNASTDLTGELLRRVAGATVHTNETNVGFVRAANQGASLGSGDLLLFLNNDVELAPTSVASAVRLIRSRADVGAVGGRIVGLDGTLQEAGSVMWRDGTAWGYGHGDSPEHGAYLFVREVDYCSGVFLLTPRRLFHEVGGFDNRFEPAYFEDSDYCFRLRQAGKVTLYDPGSLVIHYGSASLARESDKMRFIGRNRPLFRSAHRDALETVPQPSGRSMLRRRDRSVHRRRLLLVEAERRVGGAGQGLTLRTLQLIELFAEMEIFTTVLVHSTDSSPGSGFTLRSSIPNVEIIALRSASELCAFVESRPDYYHTIVARGLGNISTLWGCGVHEQSERPRVVLDLVELTGSSVEMGCGPPSREAAKLLVAVDEVWTVSSACVSSLSSTCGRVRWIPPFAPREAMPAMASRTGVLVLGVPPDRGAPEVPAELPAPDPARVGQLMEYGVPVRIMNPCQPDEAEGGVGVGSGDALRSAIAMSRAILVLRPLDAEAIVAIVEAAASGVSVIGPSWLSAHFGGAAPPGMLEGDDYDHDLVESVLRDGPVRDESSARIESEMRSWARTRFGRDAALAAVGASALGD